MNTPIERRRFLAASAGMLALPRLSPGRDLPPSERINLAICGVGARGYGVMRGFAGHRDVRFRAVCDPFKSRRERARAYLVKKAGHREVATYADYRRVLERADIDALVICTPDHWHVPLALAAAAAGKDMYVEKPLGISMAWAARLREAVNNGRRVFQYGTQQRSNRRFRHTCEMVRNGRIGKVLAVDAWCVDGTRAREWMDPKTVVSEPVPADLDYDLWLGPAPAAQYNKWRVNREGAFHTYDYAIGFIAGWGAHPLDIVQWGLDMDRSGPVEYRGTGTIPATGGLYSTVYDWDVHCRYASGVKLHFMSHNIARPVVMKYRKRWSSHGTTFFGSRGWISVDRSGIETNVPGLDRAPLRAEDLHLTVSRSHSRNFLDCIRSRAETITPLEAAIRSDAISHLSDIAIRTGRTLKWDPRAERILGDEAANRLLHRPMRPPYLF